MYFVFDYLFKYKLKKNKTLNIFGSNQNLSSFKMTFDTSAGPRISYGFRVPMVYPV